MSDMRKYVQANKFRRYVDQRMVVQVFQAFIDYKAYMEQLGLDADKLYSK
jgi:hypothetical protein